MRHRIFITYYNVMQKLISTTSEVTQTGALLRHSKMDQKIYTKQRDEGIMLGWQRKIHAHLSLQQNSTVIENTANPSWLNIPLTTSPDQTHWVQKNVTIHNTNPLWVDIPLDHLTGSNKLSAEKYAIHKQRK